MGAVLGRRTRRTVVRAQPGGARGRVGLHARDAVHIVERQAEQHARVGTAQRGVHGLRTAREEAEPRHALDGDRGGASPTRAHLVRGVVVERHALAALAPDRREAFAAQAVRRRDVEVAYFLTSPEAEPVKNNPRYRAAARALNLNPIP